MRRCDPRFLHTPREKNHSAIQTAIKTKTKLSRKVSFCGYFLLRMVFPIRLEMVYDKEKIVPHSEHKGEPI